MSYYRLLLAGYRIKTANRTLHNLRIHCYINHLVSIKGVADLMNLYGKKVMLRPIQQSDFAKIVYWSNEDKINCFSEGNYPTSMEQCATWLQHSISNRYQERFAIVLGKTIIGDIELDQITWRSGDAELRIRIGEMSNWDRGYGTDAINTLLNYAFYQMHLSRIYLKVYTDNKRAVRCYNKVGFKKEGRLKRRNNRNEIREIYLMRILKTEFAAQEISLNSISQ